MSRVRVNPYGASKSARELSTYLGIKRLRNPIRITGPRFRGKNGDTVINWGMGKGDVGNARQINKLENVQLASNKLRTLQILTEANVSVPCWTSTMSGMAADKLYMARTTLSGHSGRGIVLGTSLTLPNAPLYVEYIEKVREYRAIVVGDRVVDFKQKKKRNTPEGEEPIEHNPSVWNLDGGYIFARNGIERPDGVDQLGVDAVSALGLDFGAVDIIEDEEGKLYVLEVNTAFGIEGTTLSLVGEAIKEIL